MPGHQLLCVLGGTYLTMCSSRAATAAHRAGQTVSGLHHAVGFNLSVRGGHSQVRYRANISIINDVQHSSVQVLLLSLKHPHQWQRKSYRFLLSTSWLTFIPSFCCEVASSGGTELTFFASLCWHGRLLAGLLGLSILFLC